MFIWKLLQPRSFPCYCSGLVHGCSDIDLSSFSPGTDQQRQAPRTNHQRNKNLGLLRMGCQVMQTTQREVGSHPRPCTANHLLNPRRGVLPFSLMMLRWNLMSLSWSRIWSWKLVQVFGLSRSLSFSLMKAASGIFYLLIIWGIT